MSDNQELDTNSEFHIVLDGILNDPTAYRFNITTAEYLKKNAYATSGTLLANLRTDEMKVVTEIVDGVHTGAIKLEDAESKDAQQIVWLACAAMQAEGIPLSADSVAKMIPLFLMHCTIESLSRKGLVVVNRDVFALSAPDDAEICKAVI